MRKPLLIIVALAVLVGACNGPFVDALPLLRPDVDAILGDTSLSAQETRAALEELGLSPLVINALLQSSRIANQYGGDLRSAYEKVTESRFDELTPDEVQIYGDAASEADDAVDYELSDREAQAIVTFFLENKISSKDDLLNFLDEPANVLSISGDIPDGALSDLFIDFDTSLLIDLLA